VSADVADVGDIHRHPPASQSAVPRRESKVGVFALLYVWAWEMASSKGNVNPCEWVLHAGKASRNCQNDNEEFLPKLA
jgi:hypothetical protein